MFDHTRRTTSPAIQAEARTRTPAAWVHGDYTPESAQKRFDANVPAGWRATPGGGSGSGGGTAVGGARRWEIVNVWRTINGVVRRKPMVFMANSREAARRGDAVVVRRVSGHEGKTSEIIMARHDPSHRWLTFPSMRMDEAVVFRTYSSAEPRTGGVLHTAADPPAPALTGANAAAAAAGGANGVPAPHRESMEVRAICIW